MKPVTVCVHCRSPVEINVAKMGNSETKKRTTADYTGPQSNQARVKRSLTLNPQKRKQSVRLKNRPASIGGSTGLWDDFDPSRRRYLETDLDLYHELQNHLENARRRMRDKGKKDVSGGLDASLVTGEEKCYDPNDTTLTFVEGEDDMDFEGRDYKSLRARMSCGHSVTPMSLTSWCHHLLDQGESRFVCGQPDCNAEWSHEEVCKMALLTPAEIKYFEKKMLSSTVMNYLEVSDVSASRGKS